MLAEITTIDSTSIIIIGTIITIIAGLIKFGDRLWKKEVTSSSKEQTSLNNNSNTFNHKLDQILSILNQSLTKDIQIQDDLKQVSLLLRDTVELVKLQLEIGNIRHNEIIKEVERVSHQVNSH